MTLDRLVELRSDPELIERLTKAVEQAVELLALGSPEQALNEIRGGNAQTAIDYGTVGLLAAYEEGRFTMREACAQEAQAELEGGVCASHAREVAASIRALP